MCSADELFVEKAQKVLNNRNLSQEERDEAITQSKVDVIKRAGKKVKKGYGTREQVDYFNESEGKAGGVYKISRDARAVNNGTFQKGLEKSIKRLEMKEKAKADSKVENKDGAKKMTPEEFREANLKADKTAAALIEQLELEEKEAASKEEGKHASKVKNSKGSRKGR